MKICSKCNLKKEHLEFYASKSNLDGLEGRCKTCKSVYIKYRWRTNDAYRSQHGEYYKNRAKYKVSDRLHECLACGIEIKTKTAPNRTGWCRYCAEKITNQKWTQNNLPLKASITAKRRATKLQATPPWLTNNQLNSIKLYYKTAKWIQLILQEKIEVDHIIPLQGENISGLHVPWNLQLLTKKDNCSKGNKHG